MVGRGHFAYLDLATLGDGGSMGMTSARAVARLADEATRLLSGYRHSDALRTTATLKQLAEIIVELRSLLTMEDGRTDLGGGPRSTGTPPPISTVALASSRGNARHSLRYHVGNLLRERVAREEFWRTRFHRPGAARPAQAGPRRRLGPNAQWRRVAAYASTPPASSPPLTPSWRACRWRALPHPPCTPTTATPLRPPWTRPWKAA